MLAKTHTYLKTITKNNNEKANFFSKLGQHRFLILLFKVGLLISHCKFKGYIIENINIRAIRVLKIRILSYASCVLICDHVKKQVGQKSILKSDG